MRRQASERRLFASRLTRLADARRSSAGGRAALLTPEAPVPGSRRVAGIHPAETGAYARTPTLVRIGWVRPGRVARRGKRRGRIPALLRLRGGRACVYVAS